MKKLKQILNIGRRSNIKTYYGEYYDIERVYKDLTDREDINITSVSVTRVDKGGMKGYVDKYMIAVSYNYYK